MSELRVSRLSKESWELLCTRIANRLSLAEVVAFDSALRLYFTTEEVRQTNFDKLAATNQSIKRIKACHRGQNAAKATKDKADNLSPNIYVCIRAQVMLTTNLWTKVGLVNGSIGSIYNIAWDPRQDPALMPSIILIKFDEYIGPEFLCCPQGIVPMFSITRQFDFKGIACSCTYFPLRLAYTITVHKSQGLTLPKVGLNLNCREHCLGLSYVAVSRVKTLDGILFEGPFDFELFKPVDSATSRDRELDFIFRNTQLI